MGKKDLKLKQPVAQSRPEIIESAFFWFKSLSLDDSSLKLKLSRKVFSKEKQISNLSPELFFIFQNFARKLKV